MPPPSIDRFAMLDAISEKSKINEIYLLIQQQLTLLCGHFLPNPSEANNLQNSIQQLVQQGLLPNTLGQDLQAIRATSHAVLNGQKKVEKTLAWHDFGRWCQVLKHVHQQEVPELLQKLIAQGKAGPVAKRRCQKYDRIRVSFSHKDAQFLYAFDEAMPSETPIKIAYNTAINQAFNTSMAELSAGFQLNLVDVYLDKDGIYQPDLIIVEPDYLMDVSALSEAMKSYGEHPLNFVMARLLPSENTKHMLLGNMANLFLDELIHQKPEKPLIYKEILSKAFKNAAFNFSTCLDIDEAFFNNVKSQYHNISKAIANVLPHKNIQAKKAILEPSFICETLGIQGRLDFLQLDHEGQKQVVIELKSGKAAFPEQQTDLIAINHNSQAFLYQIIIQKVLGVPFKEINTYILYSKYADAQACLRLAQPSMLAIKKLLDLRNQMVINEKKIALDDSESLSKALISDINLLNLVDEKEQGSKFVRNYIQPQIEAFQTPFAEASPLVLAYFHSFYHFVSREHYLAKVGSIQEGRQGLSGLWRSPLQEKLSQGEILINLSMSAPLQAEQTELKLNIPAQKHGVLPNFRAGDVVILYQRNHDKDHVGTQQIFKASVQDINPQYIILQLRMPQSNPAVLPMASLYAVERDFLDSTFVSMYKGLFAFLTANEHRQKLLLNQRAPEHDPEQSLSQDYGSDSINQIALKAKQAKDYFLLLGPPGTGKTSQALRAMILEFEASGHNILLLSYTNRAVDEICEVLVQLPHQPAFIRIGASLSCDEAYHDNLLGKVTSDCENRKKVREKISQTRIFVATVAALSGKHELFKLKHFEVAIIDEASQILEPHLLGILSAKNNHHQQAIGKFIMIGDHKQLPAIVQQSDAQALVKSPLLKDVGVINRKQSLFERLYQWQQNQAEPWALGMLQKQGRMHPEIAEFPNLHFYQKQLQEVPTKHQTEALHYENVDETSALQQIIATNRLAFLPSKIQSGHLSPKTNLHEAEMVKLLLENIYQLYQNNQMPFVADKTVGIITPYRSQIALIKQKIDKLNIPILNKITVDTVERFQGSQRDIIIYSFSINQAYQLDFVANTMQDQGQAIDRKLNVAITRARKQLFVLGNADVLAQNLIYKQFIDFCKAKNAYFEVGLEGENAYT
jgi:AAA domain